MPLSSLAPLADPLDAVADELLEIGGFAHEHLDTGALDDLCQAADDAHPGTRKPSRPISQGDEHDRIQDGVSELSVGNVVGLAAGEYVVRAAADGFKPIEKRVTIHAGEIAPPIVFKLAPISVELAPEQETPPTPTSPTSGHRGTCGHPLRHHSVVDQPLRRRNSVPGDPR